MNDTNTQPEASQNPDYRAVYVIFDEYAPLIYKYVGGFCHDPEEAEGIFGDVFAHLLEKTSLRKRPPSDARINMYRMEKA